MTTPSPAARQAPEITYDLATDIVTIDGYKFARDLLCAITTSPCGVRYRIIDRKDGVITIGYERNALEAAAPDMLAQLRIADFWLEHLIEDLEIDTGTTTLNINAVSPGNVKNLAQVNLETSLGNIRAVIAKATELCP